MISEYHQRDEQTNRKWCNLQGANHERHMNDGKYVMQICKTQLT